MAYAAFRFTKAQEGTDRLGVKCDNEGIPCARLAHDDCGPDTRAPEKKGAKGSAPSRPRVPRVRPERKAASKSRGTLTPSGAWDAACGPTTCQA
uniref:Uncharacterized protein n=1 Tax=Oryza brachyantha TaxID=4533 RepID=J3LW41_ORYBR